MTISENTADITDLHAAARLLTEAHLASACGRLLGSATITTPDPAVAAYTDILTTALRRGHLDLAYHGGEVVGAACWISHPARHAPATDGPAPTVSRLPRRARPGGPARDLLDRLNVLDEAFPATGRAHLHLACLGIRPGRDPRPVTGLLLHRRQYAADRDGHRLHAEVHTPAEQAWLHDRGYRQDGISLTLSSAERSWAMVRAPQT